jgi:RHS repeat-associated protein
VSTTASLGSYRFIPGAGHKVEFSDRANGQVMADALKLVPAVTGGTVARWQGSVAAGGDYQLFAKWPLDATLAPDARYTLAGGLGVPQSVTVDHGRGGGEWRPLGRLTLAANDNWQVELSDQANGAVAADAPVGVGRHSSVGAIVPASSLGDVFRWQPLLPSAGRYDIFARWSAAAGRSDRAEYRIVHGGGTSSVAVDQRQGAGTGGGSWRYLGSYDLDPAAGPAQGVELSAALSGSVSADAIRFVRRPVSGGVSYILSDQIGQPQKMLDGAGTLNWDRIATPFGETGAMALGAAGANILRFPGQQYEATTGLHYNYFRDYDPSIGRYAQSDPIGLAGGLNTYAYVGANPVSRIDPWGLLDVFIWEFRGSNDAWGHASVQLNNGTYISWWPNTRNTSPYKYDMGQPLFSAPPLLEEYRQTVGMEGRPPDAIIHIDGLNEAAIQKWWEEFKNDNQWDTLWQNCSTTVADALAAGGGDMLASLGGGNSLPRAVWTPKDVQDYANAIQRGSDRLESIQMFFGQPRTNYHYPSPRR